MNDREFADEIRRRWPNWRTLTDASCAGLIDTLLRENPPWEPKPGDLVEWNEPSDYRKEQVSKGAIIGPDPDEEDMFWVKPADYGTRSWCVIERRLLRPLDPFATLS